MRRQDKGDRVSGLPSVVATAAAAVVLLASTQASAAPKPPPRADKGALANVERNLKNRKSRDALLGKRLAELIKELSVLREKIVATAQHAQFREAALLRTELDLAGLEQREAKSRDGYRTAQRQLARTLWALMRIKSHPPGAFAIRFANASDAIRSMVALQALAPRLEQRAAALRRRLRAYARLKTRIEERRDELKGRRDAVNAARVQLANLVAKQAVLMNQTERDRALNSDRISALTRRARSLRELLDRIDREKNIPAAKSPRADALTRPNRVRPFRRAHGRLTMPVAGRIVRRFGQTNEFGIEAKGIEIAVSRGARVVAPYDGQIVFAGPFRSYGRILIIRHSDGYHSLVAGLSRIDVVNKQWVLAGEPVGVIQGDDATRPRLYLEIRRMSRPINPLPWISADQRKVNG